ncbi:MAG: prolyl oligopeptidase family serine peptidase [Terriglobia bacterium]|nr:prolyl oligopeptidase family serine peptidase [Terriglobia bacterium]
MNLRRPCVSVYAVAYFLCVLLLVPAGSAQATKPFDVRGALGVLSFSNRMPISLSPDGEWVAYTVEDDRKVSGTKDERYMFYTPTGAFTEAIGCDVLVTNTRTGETRNLTQGKGTSSSAVWSPDGKLLAFYSDRTGTERLWIWNRATGEMRQLSDAIPRPFFNFQVPRWSPDGRSLLVKILPAGMTVEQAADLIRPSPTPKTETKHNGVTVTVFKSEPAAAVQSTTEPTRRVTDERWMNRYDGDLALIDVATGKINRIATGIRPLGYWFSPNGESIVYTDWKGMEENSQQPVYDIDIFSMSSRTSRILVPKTEEDYGQSVSWSPDGRSLAYLTSKGDCFIVSLNGGDPTNVTAGKPHPKFNDDHRAPLWDSSGRRIYLLSSEQYGRSGTDKIWAADLDQHSLKVVAEIPGTVILEVAAPRGGGRLWEPMPHSMLVLARNEATKDTGFYKIDLQTGAVSKIFSEPRYFGRDSIFTTDVSSDGKTIAYVAQDAQHPEEVWVAGPDLQNRHQLTHINPQLDGCSFGSARIIDYRSIDGQQLHGALLLPAAYQPGKRYPLIVDVYGGSLRSDTLNRFGLSGSGVENLQILATRGYAVLLPDTPLHKKTPMQDLLKTVMPAVDRAVDLGIADPDRLGAMGHSYGGYSTLSLIVQTTRFRAAVDSAGPADLISAYGEMDKDGSAFGIGWSETGQGGMEGTPWQVRDRYIENSPLFYLDRVVTPLLIIQGELDHTVPHAQAEEVFVGLRRLGKEVEYARYAGEEHWEGTWSAANAEDYWNRVIEWFDEHLDRGNEGTR